MRLPKNCRAVKVRMRFPKSFAVQFPEWVEDKGQESPEAREVRMNRHDAHPGIQVFSFDRGVAVGSSIIEELDELGFVCLGVSVERRTDVQQVDEVPEFNKKRVVVKDGPTRRATVAGITLDISARIITLEQDYTVVNFDIVPDRSLITGAEVREYFNLHANGGWGHIRVFENPVIVNSAPNGNNVLSISFDAIAQMPAEENRGESRSLGYGLHEVVNKRKLADSGESRFHDSFPKDYPFSSRKVLEG